LITKKRIFLTFKEDSKFSKTIWIHHIYFRPEARKAPVIAVNKSGSRIQVVSKAVSPRKTLKSASARRRETYGTMRCDEVRKDTHRKRELKFYKMAKKFPLSGFLPKTSKYILISTP
jgi:hypothetical protein